MRRSLTFLACACLLCACGGGGQQRNNTEGQNALGGIGEGPAPKGSGGGVQNPGNTSGDNPQGEVSPSGSGSNASH